MAQLEAGGVKAIHDPITLPAPASSSRRRLSGSFQKQRKALVASRRCTHVVCGEETLMGDAIGVQVLRRVKGVSGEGFTVESLGSRVEGRGVNILFTLGVKGVSV